MECAVTNDLLDALRRMDALRDAGEDADKVRSEAEPAIEPAMAGPQVLERLAPSLRDALARHGITELYAHQADATAKALDGSNVVLQSPTASGKTLAFQLPMLDTIIREPNSRALLIYPFKALSHDQRRELVEVADLVQGSEITVESYDGDTPVRERNRIRSNPPNVVVTNPDMLHLTLLGNADKWQAFLRGLKWVVIDEMHEYRGYFGSNVSMVLRRLSHHLAHLGVRPQFFLCSATCANAHEHAQRLTGLDFEEVDATECMRPKREYHFVRPNVADFHYWEALQQRTVNAGLACLAQGKNVLAFCPTRNFAEDCYEKAMSRVADTSKLLDTEIDASTIKVYKAGLTAEARHEIQEGLRDGSVRLAFTTNALEAGINIGGLDGIILAGFPDNLMSARQRIGRAGRRWDADAFVLYFARNNPLDEFFASNLGLFLQKPLDNLVINEDNEELVKKHVQCLLQENDTPVTDESRELLGDSLCDEAMAVLNSGRIPIRGGHFPHQRVDIRGGGAGMYKLVVRDHDIGTISPQQQFREAFPGAIYRHGGIPYRVLSVVQEKNDRKVLLEEDETGNRTRPYIRTTVNEGGDIFDAHRWETSAGAVNVMLGNVSIMQHFERFEEIGGREDKVYQPDVNAPPVENAHAFWIDYSSAPTVPTEGITALQHLLRIGMLRVIPTDPQDVMPHVKVSGRKVYIIENYQGGIGIARAVLAVWREVLEEGIRLADGCRDCVRGCPSCIQPPRETEEMDKQAGISLARALLALTSASETHHWDGAYFAPVEQT